MLATVRTTVLPEFAVEVYPTAEDEYDVRQSYVLSLYDGTVGRLELLFPSAQDLQAFLTYTREGLAAAKQEARDRKARLRRRSAPRKAQQATLF